MKGIYKEQSELDLALVKLKYKIYSLMQSVVEHDKLSLKQLKVLITLEFIQLAYFILSPSNDPYFYKEIEVIHYARQLL